MRDYLNSEIPTKREVAVAALDEALAALKDLALDEASRELSLSITNAEQSAMWLKAKLEAEPEPAVV